MESRGTVQKEGKEARFEGSSFKRMRHKGPVFKVAVPVLARSSLGGQIDWCDDEALDEATKMVKVGKASGLREIHTTPYCCTQGRLGFCQKILRPRPRCTHCPVHLHKGDGTPRSNGRSIEFVEKLVDLVPPEALALRTIFGETALYSAAKHGNTKAAVILLEKDPTSLYIGNNEDWLPLHTAASNGHKDTLLYLLSVTKEDDPVSKPFAYPSGALLLFQLVESQFYDVALDLVGHYPELAMSTLDDGGCALKIMAVQPSSFPSGIRLNRWQRLIYSLTENPVNSSQVITQKHSWARILETNFPNSVSQKLQAMLWKVLELLVPHTKHVQKQKLIHLQAIQLVKSVCEKIRSSHDSKVSELIWKDVILLASSFGIHEIVEEVVESFPQAAWSLDKNQYSIFGLAVIYRYENVFNLIYQMSGYKQAMFIETDSQMNNILHLAGRLAPFDKLNLVPGAALQMQHELKWFKEVEKFVTTSYKEFRNREMETPSMVFTKEHKKLVEEGEKWMKDTANSCTIAAALIATIAFAAVITVPGGINGTNGVPVFSKANAFIVFIVSDAISPFTSTMSLLMFLSILTSCYAEGDFLYVLPKRLIIGLVTLFMSITTMMLAFSSTLYLVFGNNKGWILIPVATFACLPITSFVSLQFPLLVDLISSTYGPGIFGKKSDRLFF
ncbi:Ankyrin repeat-containing protein NPR4 [Camellia lanceoleosa]|uniref:Ankyrin repeat-containing protein NPR4 n=1 Tax=Camellia lanceoleosa TaxID=1840588 RepID=A0ACC0GVX6_9ERIC|nr:Ankyrin repeat-containing protein NPR4 [Camellia lanceoleosa]